ncbi:2'-5' RNA ligase family protein [Synechococcus sp. H55.11]|uniref:2'-5' RNA ligase family protein n=1 Tax=Synechococcus sp. H55.11 TaxID=2967121 RepID=UPI0039C2AA1F
MVNDAPQQRLFLALLPPADLQEQVTAIKQQFAEQFASRAALRSPPHITLVPPFEWPTAELPALTGSLGEFAKEQAPVAVELRGFGAFAPRVIYIHVEPSPELQQLQAKTQRHMNLLLKPEPAPTPARPFVPHMTVAFRDLSPAQFRTAWPQFKTRPFQGSFLASALTLLSHDGKRWQVFAEFSLSTSEGLRQETTAYSTQ